TSGSAITGGFAAHCDWRLPSIVELTGIVDQLSCDTGACIDQTAFGPTAAYQYWSATTDAPFPKQAWYVDFGHFGETNEDGIKSLDIFFVRGVRSGLGSTVREMCPACQARGPARHIVTESVTPL